jgi:hypothetical protein
MISKTASTQTANRPAIIIFLINPNRIGRPSTDSSGSSGDLVPSCGKNQSHGQSVLLPVGKKVIYSEIFIN